MDSSWVQWCRKWLQRETMQVFLIYTLSRARRYMDCLEAWAKKKKRKRNRRMARRHWCSLSCKFWAPLSTTSWNKDRKSGMILKRTDKKWISTQRQSPCCWWRGRDSSTLWDTAAGSTALLCDDDNTHPEIKLVAHMWQELRSFTLTIHSYTEMLRVRFPSFWYIFRP